MAAKAIFYTTDELISALEERAQESRDRIGTTRTKLESNELKGEVYAFNEAIYMVKALARGQKEWENGSPDTVENLDSSPSSNTSAPVPASSK